MFCAAIHREIIIVYNYVSTRASMNDVLCINALYGG